MYVADTIPHSVVKNKNKQNINNENYLLSKQIKKLDLNRDFLLMEDEEEEDETPTQKITNFEDLKNKNLAQIIMESQRKVQQKLDNKK